jgi:hypothetical protein
MMRPREAKRGYIGAHETLLGEFQSDRAVTFRDIDVQSGSQTELVL